MRKTKEFYTPFGVGLKNRDFSSEKYRYGFQGQEKDDELKGKGNSVNFTYRMHDPRLGRFFAVDPLSQKYAHNSPYSFSENRVIDAIELEGLETFKITTNSAGNPYLSFTQKIDYDMYGKPILKVIDENKVELTHFKYCEFQCHMKNFRVRDSKIGLTDQFEIEFFNEETGKSIQAFDGNTFGKVAIDKSLVILKDDPAIGHTIWQNDVDYYNEIDKGTYMPNGPIDQFEFTVKTFEPDVRMYLGITADQNMATALENKYDYIKIYNTSDYTTEEIIEVLRKTNNFSDKLKIEIVDVNPHENDSEDNPAVISIAFGNYEECCKDANTKSETEEESDDN